MAEEPTRGPSRATPRTRVRPRREAVVLTLFSVLSLAFASAYVATLAPTRAAATPRVAVASGRATASAGKAADVASVVEKANAFEALLSASQLAEVQLEYSPDIQGRWSNLPCGASCRNGILLGDLSDAQLAAALDVIRAAAGTAADEGYDEFNQIRAADDILAAQGGGGGGGPGGGGGGYGSGIYLIAFLNEPSTTGAWMLQYGGHHYAANIAYNGGHVVGATPQFEGVEPTTFTSNGTTYSPLTQERDAMAELLASLSSAQLATAKLSQTFSDVTLSPGEANGGSGTFPSNKVGIAVSTLSAEQKALVLAAVAPWVRDVNDTVAENLLSIYENELDGTYVAYTGDGTSGDASSFLNTNTNYVRVDGPSVWVEFICQNGIVFQNQIHYHSVWRDHTRDYGADLSLTTPLDAADSTPTTPAITGASFKQKKLTVTGTGFASGSVVVIDSVDQSTKYTSPMTLVSKKANKAVKKGETVTVQVRNADGTLSNELSYTRPA